MKEIFSIKEKVQPCFWAALIIASFFSWVLLSYSCPAYDIKPLLSFQTFVPTLLVTLVVFMALILLGWICIDVIVWSVKKYFPAIQINMKEIFSIKEKVQPSFWTALIVASFFSWALLSYSCPEYDIKPLLSFQTFVPTLLVTLVVFMALILLGWICIDVIVWSVKKYFPTIKQLFKEIPALLYKEKGKHILLHVLLLMCNVPIQQIVNGMRSATFHFSQSLHVRVFDTLICYSIMLLFAYAYLKLTKCNVKSFVYYAIIGILPCLITALGLEWLEYWKYEIEFCSHFGDI